MPTRAHNMKSRVDARASSQGVKKMKESKKRSKIKVAKKCSFVKSKVDKVKVTFNVPYPWYLEDGLDPSPYIHLTKQSNKESVRYLSSPREQVIPAAQAILIINYPVAYEKRVLLRAANGKAFTRVELVRKIAKAYQDMYDEEANTASLSIETMQSRTNGGCALLNRAPTDGKYGIWGHDLDDLLLDTVYYNEHDNTILVQVDS